MPKQVTPANVKEKWNFYFPQLLKLEMHKKLVTMNLQGQQSALLRALIRLFVDNKIDETELKKVIQEEIYITPNGKQSKL